MATGLMLKKLVLKKSPLLRPGRRRTRAWPLNVLIGPNASGKSNLIDAIRLLAACPKDVIEPIALGGGFEAWRHQSNIGRNLFEVEAEIDDAAYNPEELASLGATVVHRVGIYAEEPL